MSDPNKDELHKVVNTIYLMVVLLLTVGGACALTVLLIAMLND